MNNDTNALEKELLALVDGPFRPLRDTNHIDPYSILVWDPSRTPVIESVEILELLDRYPCGGELGLWTPSDFVEILTEKRDLYNKSKASHAISDADPQATPACGTVLLIIREPRHPHIWLGLSALMDPGQHCS